jgi:hypothetical protein
MHARIRRIRNRWRSRRLLRLQRFVRDENGLQLVEVAIVVPIFLMLFAATAEFGRYYYEYTTLSKNVRDAARYLTTVYPGQGDSTAQKMIVYGNPAGTGSPILQGLDPTNVKITYKGGAIASNPDTVTVEIINYKHTPIFDLGKLTKTNFSTNVGIKPSVTMKFLLTQPPPIPG